MAVWLEDKKLVKQLLAGDERAFDRFFDENFARLYRFALVRLSDDSDAAREVAQITLSKAVRKLHTYKAEAALFTWLCSICRNETSDWLAKQIRYREHIVLTEDFAEVRAAVESLQEPDRMGPERQYRRIELLRLIQVALDNLPPNYGDVLEWKYIQGHSVEEIAERMNLGSEATQSLLARARRAFADVYSSLTEGLERHENELVNS
ncbi:MAG: RNA polymerase sigma factor [Gammaproteobacteria bacterium]|jgi:RNA polymerase sigma-70 factor (ECF subfamily)|nr:RNA polymerase sigma factor [Gammaproteobacteria bacterium]MDH3819768.1 RNA polymerase sigma factor [Gammaproteobacteria bacterium]